METPTERVDRSGAAKSPDRGAGNDSAKKPTVRFTQGAGWRVATPSFAYCERMDAFYAEAHRLIEAQFTAERERERRASLAADFTVREDGGELVIALRLRRRELGRVVARKTLVHRWRGGYIAPGDKSPFTIISKIREKHKGEKKNGA